MQRVAGLVACLLLTGCLEPAGSTSPRVTAPASTNAAPIRPPQPRLFLDAQPTCVDPAQFLPEPLRQFTGDEPLTITLESLPGLLRTRFGVSALVDRTRLQEFGAAFDVPHLLPAKLPLYLALQQVLDREELVWIWNAGVLTITTAEYANQELTTQQHNVARLLRKMHPTSLLAVVENCAGDEEYGPWMNVHGSGGTLILAGETLSVRQTQRVQTEVARLLKGLESPQPFLLLDLSEQDLQALSALKSEDVTVQFYETELQAAMQFLAQQAGVPIRLDELRLTEFGIGGDLTITIKLPSRPLGQVLELILQPHELAAIPLDGVLTVTTAEYANGHMEQAIFNLSDIVPEFVAGDQIISLLYDQTGNEEYGPWLNIHGTGGTLETPMAGMLVVRQTNRVLGEVRDLLDRLRQDIASRPLPSERDPQAFETRYYRLPLATARDLLRLLPHRIAAGAWNTPTQSATDADKGTAEIVEVGMFWRQYPNAGFDPAAHRQDADPFREFDAVLIVRQRIGIQKQLGTWLNQILFGNRQHDPTPRTVPNGRLPD
jgi:hypothetical protein